MKKSLLVVAFLLMLFPLQRASADTDYGDLDNKFINCGLDPSMFDTQFQELKQYHEERPGSDDPALYIGNGDGQACKSNDAVRLKGSPDPGTKVSVDLDFNNCEYSSSYATSPDCSPKGTVHMEYNSGEKYTYCTLNQTGLTVTSAVGNTTDAWQINYGQYPMVTRIMFSAPGYSPQSYPINPNKTCNTGESGNGTPVGGIDLEPIATGQAQYECKLDNETDPTKSVCVDKATEAITSDTNLCKDEATQQPNCGELWYLDCRTISGGGLPVNKCDTGIVDCLKGDIGQQYSVSDTKKFPTERACRTGVTTLKIISLPTPTPLPPPPPCAVKLYDNKGCTSIFSAIGPLNTDSFKFIGQLFAVLLSISGGIALLLIIRSGYQLMTSQGNPEKVKEARERLTSVFVGLLFLVLSIVILEVIGVDLLSLPGLNK